MAPGLGHQPAAVDRFEREASILKQLNHPNIVRFYGTGKYQGTPLLTPWSTSRANRSITSWPGAAG